tara:strand:- start:304 stop:528 length:225 start_codon:yes stop_codon:yes gene_type:complete
LKTNLKAQTRNRIVRTQVRNAIKKVRQAEDADTAQQALGQAISIIDNGTNKKVLHRNTAARHKSRLTKLVEKMS